MSRRALLAKAPQAEDLWSLASSAQNPPLLVTSSCAIPCSSPSLLPSRLVASLKVLFSLTTSPPPGCLPAPWKKKRRRQMMREGEPPFSASTSCSSPACLRRLSPSPLTSLLCSSLHSSASLVVLTSDFRCPANTCGGVQRLLKHLHPVENQVVGFAKTLEEVVQLLSLDPSIVVITLAETKANLTERKTL